MKRHTVIPEALEAGRGAGPRGGTVSMIPPNIQPYQASAGRGSMPSAAAAKQQQQQREGYQKAIAVGVAIWLGGWFLFGYSILWPLNLVLNMISGIFQSTPFGAFFSWWDRGMPTPDLYQTATELRIPGSQVSRYVDSYVQSYGDAALIFAAHDGYAQLVSGLLLSRDLGYGDLIDAADESGHTALLYAAGRGFQQVALALLQAGADPDAPKQGKAGRGLTPLMEAAGTGHRELVTLLLKANATVDLRDEYGNTALMYAAYGGHLGALQELLQRGAMRDLANRQGTSALAMAAANSHQALVDALQRGARPVVEPQARRSRLQTPSARRGAGDKQTLAEKTNKPEPEAEAEPERPAKSLAAKALEQAMASMAATPKADSDGSAEKQVKQLEAQLAELKRAQEASELKSQRRIVELLEQSADKQKLLDVAEKERQEARRKSDDLAAKLRQKEEQSLEDEQRHARLSKEAHEARMEAERERSRADAAEREGTRREEAEKRLQDAAQQSHADAEQHAAQAERLQQQLVSMRAELERAEEERRVLRQRLDGFRAGGVGAAPPVEVVPGIPASSTSIASASSPVASGGDAVGVPGDTASAPSATEVPATGAATVQQKQA